MRYVVAAILILAACGRHITSPPTGRLDVTVSVMPADFRVGETVTVATTVANGMGRAQTIETNSCLPAFEVTTPGGIVVAPGQRICPLASMPKTLAPGEQFVFTQSWSGDALRLTTDSPSAVLVAGTYRVRGRPFSNDVDNPSVTIHVNP